MKKNVQIVLGFFILMLFGCKRISVQSSGSVPPSHAVFDSLLYKHVDSLGLVNYQQLIQDSTRLNMYLGLLRDNIPNDSNWTSHDKIAYWINLYNAFTLKLILDHYPVNSIKEIGDGPQIPFINSPWDIKFIELNGSLYDLNNIEHNILRKMDEPRIHFAIVCASLSCPVLQNEAYHGSKLENQLADQTKKFLEDPSRNQLTESTIKISKIFKWFRSDFTTNGSLIDFLNDQQKKNISSQAEIDYLPYDWGLNEQHK